jgi:hypothetical protein
VSREAWKLSASELKRETKKATIEIVRTMAKSPVPSD